MNNFNFQSSILKNIKDYGNVIKANVKDSRLEQLADGNYRSKFVASRQVTIWDPEVQALLRANIVDETTELVVDMTGYATSTLSEKNQKWYDNQVVTSIKILG